jgi:hypothetical protein
MIRRDGLERLDGERVAFEIPLGRLARVALDDVGGKRACRHRLVVHLRHRTSPTTTPAITFAETFYRALGAGGSVSHAYERAVNQLGLQDRPNVTEILVRPGVDADTMTLRTMSAA